MGQEATMKQSEGNPLMWALTALRSWRAGFLEFEFQHLLVFILLGGEVPEDLLGS